MPASILERDVLPARVRDYTPRLLDELGAAGGWSGSGAGRWAATMAGSRSTGAIAPSCWPPPAPSSPRAA